jgi:hypothetical protein
MLAPKDGSVGQFKKTIKYSSPAYKIRDETMNIVKDCNYKMFRKDL